MSGKAQKARAADAEPESYRAPKLPRTTTEKDAATRLVVVLEGASLESVKVGNRFELLNSTDHGNILRKNGRDGINLRPDITHQCLLMLLDSPLNKAGKLQIFIHTAKNVLIEVNPQTRIPRVYSRFCGLMVQLLRNLSVSAKGKGGAKLLKVIKNPITDHLPTGAPKIATSYGAVKTVRLREWLPTQVPSGPVTVIVGAIAHGVVDTSYADKKIGVSEYAMSAAGVCGKLTDACEEMWGIL